MAKYVESEPLDRELQELIKQHNRKCESDNSDGVLEALHRLRLAPTADVAPVVHSKWIFDGEWWEYRCVHCNGAVGNIKRFNYCPHCGAKMDL